MRACERAHPTTPSTPSTELSAPSAPDTESSSTSSERMRLTAPSAEGAVNCWATLFQNLKQYLKIHSMSTLLILAAVAVFIASIASAAKNSSSTSEQEAVDKKLIAFIVLLAGGITSKFLEDRYCYRNDGAEDSDFFQLA